ncbi:unnamed protein product [Closterium sp. NIES-54]
MRERCPLHSLLSPVRVTANLVPRIPVLPPPQPQPPPHKLGLAAGKTVAIRATGKGQNLEMTITHPDKAHKPAEAREVIVLKKDMPQIAKNITDRVRYKQLG